MFCTVVESAKMTCSGGPPEGGFATRLISAAFWTETLVVAVLAVVAIWLESTVIFGL